MPVKGRVQPLAPTHAPSATQGDVGQIRAQLSHPPSSLQDACFPCWELVLVVCSPYTLSSAFLPKFRRSVTIANVNSYFHPPDHPLLCCVIDRRLNGSVLPDIYRNNPFRSLKVLCKRSGFFLFFLQVKKTKVHKSQPLVGTHAKSWGPTAPLTANAGLVGPRQGTPRLPVPFSPRSILEGKCSNSTALVLWMRKP